MANKKNDILIEKNNKLITDEIVTRKRGRPAGSKNKVATTRPDRSINKAIPEEDRKKILAFNMALFKLPKVDKNSIQDVTDRITNYFSLCEKYSLLPTVATFALSLGIDRVTLWTWINNKDNVIKNLEVLNILKNVYSSINAQYESMLTEGKIVPVSAFFLLQNNYGYKQQTDHVITASQENSDSIQDISNRANLLED